MGREGRERVSIASQRASSYLRRHTSHVVQQPVLVAEHDRGAHDRRVGERLADEVVPARLGLVEIGRRVVRCIQVRDVHESRDADLRRNPRDALCALRMYGVVGEIPAKNVRAIGDSAAEDALGLVFTANKVVDNVGMSQALLNLVFIAKVPFLFRMLVNPFSEPEPGHKEHTVMTIWPRSPMGFKCLFSSSSR